jgi:hypothetical protein
VEIDNAKHVVIEILLLDPITDRSEVVAKVKVPGWLDAREYPELAVS